MADGGPRDERKQHSKNDQAKVEPRSDDGIGPRQHARGGAEVDKQLANNLLGRAEDRHERIELQADATQERSALVRFSLARLLLRPVCTTRSGQLALVAASDYGPWVRMGQSVFGLQ